MLRIPVLGSALAFGLLLSQSASAQENWERYRAEAIHADQAGTITATAEDAAMLLNVMAGFDERDSTSVDVDVPDYTATLNADIKGLKIRPAHATIAAFMTAFYTFRLLFLTFFGAPRMAKDVAHHIHESPRVMTVPLVVLAILTVVGAGWMVQSAASNTILQTLVRDEMRGRVMAFYAVAVPVMGRIAAGTPIEAIQTKSQFKELHQALTYSEFEDLYRAYCAGYRK